MLPGDYYGLTRAGWACRGLSLWGLPPALLTGETRFLSLFYRTQSRCIVESKDRRVFALSLLSLVVRWSHSERKHHVVAARYHGRAKTTRTRLYLNQHNIPTIDNLAANTQFILELGIPTY